MIPLISGRGAPTFIDAGAGNAESPVSGTLQVPYMSNILPGQALYAHVCVVAGTAASITTPAGWTSVGGITSTDTLAATSVFRKIADGSESGNLDVTVAGTGVGGAGRISRFSNTTGEESAATGSTDAAGTALNVPSVTATNSKTTAIAFLSANGNTTISAITGETNGDYTETVAEYATATGPFVLSCQSSPATGGAAIASGAATLGASVGYRHRIAFIALP